MTGKIYIPAGLQNYTSTHIIVLKTDKWNVKYRYIDESEAKKYIKSIQRHRFDILYTPKGETL